MITNILIMILLVTAIPSTTLPMIVSATSTSIKSESTPVSQKTTVVRSQKELDKALKDKNVSAIKLYGTKDGKKVTYKLSKDCDKKLMVMSASTVRFTIPKKVKVKSLIVYIANQKELNTWKNSSRMTTLVIMTEKATKITIGAKDFSKVHLIINAPKATIINYASFKTINVKNAGNWMNKIETSIDDYDLSDNGSNEASSNSEGTEGSTDDTSNGGTGGGFVPGPINPGPVTPTPIPPSTVEPTPTPIEPSEPSEPTTPEEPVVSDVVYIINYYVDNELQKTIKGSDLKQGEILKADLTEYMYNNLIEIDDERTDRTQLIISSDNIANNTLDIYYKTKILALDETNKIKKEIESLLEYSINNLDYKAKLRSAEAKIKLLKGEEAKIFYQKKIAGIRTYRDIIEDYNKLLMEATSDVELIYSGGGLDNIQARIRKIKDTIQENDELNIIIEEKVQEIEEIKILCKNIREALAELQLKDIENDNKITTTGYAFIEILPDDKSDIYRALTELEGKNTNLRKVVDGIRAILADVKIVKFEEEHSALEYQKERAKEFINKNSTCKVESLAEFRKALNLAENEPNQNQRSVLIHHTENLEKWYQKASVECKAEKVIVKNKGISIEALKNLEQVFKESVKNKDLSKEILEYFTNKLEDLIYEVEKGVFEIEEENPQGVPIVREKPKTEGAIVDE
nr:hypothetical protein [uncultured Lachnoclostridium sp.]